MRRGDAIACGMMMVLGAVWFAAAEAAYDGSGMENGLVQSGMLAVWYLPVAAMYLVKALRGEGRGAAIAAWAASFLTFGTMIAVNVWVTHFKPNTDHCHIPADQCLILELVIALLITGSTSVADRLSLGLLRKWKSRYVQLWLARRVLRLAGTMVLAVLLSITTVWALATIVGVIKLCFVGR